MKTKYEIQGSLYINKSGNLTDRNNKLVTLNCYSIKDLFHEESAISREHFEALLKKQDVDTICLTIHATGTDSYCTLNEAKRKELRILVDKAVRATTELGLYIIIKWCISDTPSNMEAEIPACTQLSLLNSEPIFDFFRRVAKRYQAYGNVLYEIQEATNMTAYTNAIIPLIREYDSYAVILHHTKNATAAPLKGYNIGYAPSLYANELHIPNNMDSQLMLYSNTQ